MLTKFFKTIINFIMRIFKHRNSKIINSPQYLPRKRKVKGKYSTDLLCGKNGVWKHFRTFYEMLKWYNVRQERYRKIINSRLTRFIIDEKEVFALNLKNAQRKLSKAL